MNTTLTGATMKRHPHCPLCAQPLRSKYDGVVDRLGTSTTTYCVDECGTCGLAVLNPAPTGDLSDYYPPQYLSQESADPASVHLLSRLERSYRYSQYDFDFSLFRDVSGVDIGGVGSYLDVGCGSGERVTYVNNSGCRRVAGIDRYDFAKQLPHSKVDLITTEIQDFRPADRFEVATMFHVLEHVEDPIGVLVHVRQHVIGRRGWLMVQVPNYGSIERRLFGRRWFGLDAPRHLFHFDRTTACMAIEKAGYEVEAVVSRNDALHPVTLVPSLFPGLDVQRIWTRPGSTRLKLVAQIVWAMVTVAVIPVAVLANLLNTGSMLTVIARPKYAT